MSTAPPAPAPASATLPTATAAETRRMVAGLLGARRGLVVVSAAVLVASTVAALAAPALLGRIVDVAVDGRPASALDGPVLGLLVATIANALLTGFGVALVAKLGTEVLTDLRERVVDRALATPLAELEAHGTGDLVSRVSGDVEVVAEAVDEGVPEFISSGLLVALTVVGLAALDWRLAMAGLAAVPIQALAARWYVRRAVPVYAAERVAAGERTQALHTAISGVATIWAYRLVAGHLDRIATRSARARDLAVETGRIRALLFARLNGAELVGLAASLAIGFALVRAGDATVGEATAAALYFHRLFDPIGALVLLLDNVQEAAAALARLVGVAARPSRPDPTTGDRPSDGSVDATGVSFAYPGGPDVVHGVDLRIAAGERLALVGPSGAGKTTVGKLVAGIHPPRTGRVLVGGVPVAELASGGHRRPVALVTQEVHVFAGSLADDLRLTRPDATDTDLVEALERVGALDWARALPEGLDTAVGSGGTELDSFRAQQLALARVVLADPMVVVLDEATAEAGSAGARRLELSARAALEGRSGLIIAHRLTQAAGADRIAVLEAGAVVQCGTHIELINAEGPYAEYWAAWSASRPAP